MINILCLVIGCIIGYVYYDLRREIKNFKLNFKAKEPEEKPGVTPGVYHKVNEYAGNQKTDVGIADSKTPEQLAWAEEERVRDLNR